MDWVSIVRATSMQEILPTMQSMSGTRPLSNPTCSSRWGSTLPSPHLAVDGAGNVFVLDAQQGAILEWSAKTQSLSTLSLPSGAKPTSIAADLAGNLYYTDSNLEKWNPLTQQVRPLASLTTFGAVLGLAVDRSGSVYFGDQNGDIISEWNVPTHSLPNLAHAGVDAPGGIAVDAAGNIYFVNQNQFNVQVLTRAFVPGNQIAEPIGAGADTIGPILPVGESLTGVFTPSSDQSWLTIGSVSGGVVQFSFTTNTSTPRTAHMNVLGEQITVAQDGLVVPTVTAPTAAMVTAAAAILGGSVTDDGHDAIIERGILYGPTSSNPNLRLNGLRTLEVDDAQAATGAFGDMVTGLSFATDYQFVAFATNSIGTSYSSVGTFTTLPVAPMLNQPTATGITPNAAMLGADVTGDGGATVVNRGVLFAPTALDSNPQLNDGIAVEADSSGTTGVFTVNAGGLAFATGYSYVGFATNSAGTTYTNPVATFTTLPVAPILNSPTATAITSSSCSAAPATLQAMAEAAIAKRGVLFALTALDSNPHLNDGIAVEANSSGTTGPFSVNVSEAWRLRAVILTWRFATNSVGTTYTRPVSDLHHDACRPILECARLPPPSPRIVQRWAVTSRAMAAPPSPSEESWLHRLRRGQQSNRGRRYSH